ncbi:MAG: methyltransferase domain-containing protein [Terriglobales bacterium]
MPETHRMAGPICRVEHEFTAFQVNGLGLVSHFNRKARHHSRCRLRRGRTVSKLAAIASEGKVYGLDYSQTCVAVAAKTNRRWMEMGRVEIREAPVSQLPFSDNMFDLVTAVETHFWWPDIPEGMREVLRVLKPGGALLIVAEIYKGANTRTAKLAEKYLPLSGIKLLSVTEHQELFADAAYWDVQVIADSNKGWICGIGKKPSGPTD